MTVGWQEKNRPTFVAPGEPLHVALGKRPAVISYYRHPDGEVLPSEVVLWDGSTYILERCQERGLLLWQSQGSTDPKVHEIGRYGRCSKLTPETRHPLYVSDGVSITYKDKPASEERIARNGFNLTREPQPDPFEDAEEGEVEYCAECDDFYPSDDMGCEHIQFRWDHNDPYSLDEIYTLQESEDEEPFVCLARAPAPYDEGDRKVSYRYLGTGKRASISLKSFCKKFERMQFTSDHEVWVKDRRKDHERIHSVIVVYVTDTTLVGQDAGKLLRIDRSSGLSKCGKIRLSWEALRQHALFEQPVEQVLLEKTDLGYEYHGYIGQLRNGDWVLNPCRGPERERIETHASKEDALNRLHALWRGKE